MELHDRYYELQQQRDNIIIPLGKLRDPSNESISFMNRALSHAS